MALWKILSHTLYFDVICYQNRFLLFSIAKKSKNNDIINFIQWRHLLTYGNRASYYDYQQFISKNPDYPRIGRIKYLSTTDEQSLDAFKLCSSLEGIIPALEPAHALAVLKKIAKNYSKDKIIVMNMCGRGCLLYTSDAADE